MARAGTTRLIVFTPHVAAAVVLVLLALLRGLRRPNCWSATLAQLDYRGGLIKRGLFGGVMQVLGVPHHRYAVFLLVAYVWFALLLVLLAALIHQRGLLRAAHRPLTLLVLGSFALTYLAHLVGYLDIVLLALAVGALLVQQPWLQLASAAVVGAIGILTHELYVLTCLPITLLPAFLTALETTSWRARASWLMACVSVVAGGVTIAYLLSVSAPLSVEQVKAWLSVLTANTDFPVRNDAIDVLSRSLSDNVTLMRGVADERWFKDALVSAALELLPTALLLTLAACRALWMSWDRARAALASIVLTSAVFGSLALVSVGWDVHRWAALCVINAFLAYAVVAARASVARRAVPSRWMSHAAWTLLALNLISADGFMDNVRPEPFPFRDHYYAMRKAVLDGAIEPPKR